MPKYRFEFPDEPHVEPVILEFENDEAAKDEARRATAEAMLDKIVRGIHPKSSSTMVIDANGNVLATISLPDG